MCTVGCRDTRYGYVREVPRYGTGGLYVQTTQGVSVLLRPQHRVVVKSRRDGRDYGKQETGPHGAIAIGVFGTIPANGPAANESRRDVVENPLLRMIKPRDFLIALSQDRDSAWRVSLCYGLYLEP